MPDPITLTLVDGVQIVVPDSLNMITPYVLIEQQDWFEDEIRFLRRLLNPGDKVIDIGANYGTYTLSMAKAVGPAGFVWAFEPATNCAAMITQGAAANKFDHIIVERSALSSQCGMGCLALNDHSELNALVRPERTAQRSETVPVVTLDDCLQRYGWQDIAFVKIDAEGEEANILKGGRNFLASLSPLIQFEVKVGEGYHLELVRHFTELGFRSYRLVPGLDLLVPFSGDSNPDGYLLNLFCCKLSRAADLAARGFLVDCEPGGSPLATYTSADSDPSIEDYTRYCKLGGLPYAAQLAPVWDSDLASEDSPTVIHALALYAISRDNCLDSAERFKALEASFNLLKSLCEKHPEHLRLASLARVAHDYGARSIAVSSLQQLAASIFQKNHIDVSEPFLAPAERFDSIPPGDSVSNWVLASVLEQLERLISHSSFYTGNSARRRLEIIHNLGFASPEMHRRLRLVQRRFGGAVASAIEPEK